MQMRISIFTIIAFTMLMVAVYGAIQNQWEAHWYMYLLFFSALMEITAMNLRITRKNKEIDRVKKLYEKELDNEIIFNSYTWVDWPDIQMFQEEEWFAEKAIPDPNVPGACLIPTDKIKESFTKNN